MAKYVLGIDGGATKTHCALFDTDGNRIDIFPWGPTNHEALAGGFEELEQELGRLISGILEKNKVQCGDIVKGVFGMAGVDTKFQHEKISGIIRSIGITDFVLCNDSFLGIKAGCPHGYGICVINGTGCSITGIDPAGKMFQIGGQGTLTGDAGGGGYLGALVIQSVYNYYFRGGKYTCMVDPLLKELKISSKYDFMEKVSERLENKTLNLSGLNRLVFDAANQGDPLAMEILSSVGSELARSVNGMIAELDFAGAEALDIVLAGSINVKGNNPTLVNALKQEVTEKNKNRKLNFVLLEKPPVAGAVIWALNELPEQYCGVSAKNIQAKIAEQFYL